MVGGATGSSASAIGVSDTISPIPAREGLIELRDRIFKVLKDIESGERHEPCMVVMDGWQKVGKSFLSDSIKGALEDMGYPVILLRPQLCKDGSVAVLDGPTEDEVANAKVVIIEEFGGYQASLTLGVSPDIFTEITADRPTRYKNLYKYGTRYFPRPVEFLLRLVLSLSYRRLFFEPIPYSKSMARFNQEVIPDIYIDNSAKYQLSSNGIREIFMRMPSAAAGEKAASATGDVEKNAGEIWQWAEGDSQGAAPVWNENFDFDTFAEIFYRHYLKDYKLDQEHKLAKIIDYSVWDILIKEKPQYRDKYSHFCQLVDYAKKHGGTLDGFDDMTDEDKELIKDFMKIGFSEVHLKLQIGRYRYQLDHPDGLIALSNGATITVTTLFNVLANIDITFFNELTDENNFNTNLQMGILCLDSRYIDVLRAADIRSGKAIEEVVEYEKVVLDHSLEYFSRALNVYPNDTRRRQEVLAVLASLALGSQGPDVARRAKEVLRQLPGMWEGFEKIVAPSETVSSATGNPVVGANAAGEKAAQAVGRTIFVITNVPDIEKAIRAEGAGLISDKDAIVPIQVFGISGVGDALNQLSKLSERDRVLMYMPDDTAQLAQGIAHAAGLKGISIVNLSENRAQWHGQIEECL